MEFQILYDIIGTIIILMLCLIWCISLLIDSRVAIPLFQFQYNIGKKLSLKHLNRHASNKQNKTNFYCDHN